MEIHSPELVGAEKYSVLPNSLFIDHYNKAKAFTLEFYKDTFDKYLSLEFSNTTPQKFFEEVVWVVHASGFSAKAVGKFIPRIMVKYGTVADCANTPIDYLISEVAPVCNNPAKIKAVWESSRMIMDGVNTDDWRGWLLKSFTKAEDFTKFPFIGGVTCYHISRNLGFLDSVKPDLHLNRLADHYGFDDAKSMCEATKDSIPLGLVDLCLWYHSSSFGTLQFKK